MKLAGVILLLLPLGVYAEAVSRSATSVASPLSVDPVEHKTYVIDALLWARPRTGADVSAMPPLRDAVQSMLNNPGSTLAISYPGGDDGGLWAQELFDWLVSLGVEPGLLSMQPGSAFDDRIELRVIKR